MPAHLCCHCCARRVHLIAAAAACRRPRAAGWSRVPCRRLAGSSRAPRRQWGWRSRLPERPHACCGGAGPSCAHAISPHHTRFHGQARCLQPTRTCVTTRVYSRGRRGRGGTQRPAGPAAAPAGRPAAPAAAAPACSALRPAGQSLAGWLAKFPLAALQGGGPRGPHAEQPVRLPQRKSWGPFPGGHRLAHQHLAAERPVHAPMQPPPCCRRCRARR